jgi:hypothetical protein
MMQKIAYVIALLIGLAVLAKSVAVLGGPEDGADLLRGGMLSTIVDLVAAASLVAFTALSLTSSAPWVQGRASAIAVVVVLSIGLAIQMAYAMAYADVRGDFLLGAVVYGIAAVLIVISRRRQLFVSTK